jgi:hypothetical protein
MSKQYMTDKQFQELLEGVREMKAIQRGEIQPERKTTLEVIVTNCKISHIKKQRA